MKRIISVGLLLVALFLFASSIIYSSGTRVKLSPKAVASAYQYSTDSYNLTSTSDQPYSAECTEQISFTDENSDSGIEKLFHLLHNQNMTRAKNLNQLNFITSKLFYFRHLAQIQSKGFYLYSLCKVLI